MYNWKAEIDGDVLEDSKGDKFGDIQLDKLEKFIVYDEDSNEAASVDLINGELKVKGEEKVKKGDEKKRQLIWLKRNLAQPNKPLKTTYYIGYYEDGKKVAYLIDPEGKVRKA